MVDSVAGAAYESLVDLPQQLPEELVEELLEVDDVWATGTPSNDRCGDPRGGSSASPPQRDVPGTRTRVSNTSADTGAGAAAKSSEAPAAAAPATAKNISSANPSNVRVSPSPPLRMVARGSLQRKSTLSLRAVRQGEEPLRQWVLPGYDVYVITLQETISDSVFHAITLFLRKENGIPYRRLQAAEDRISGLGDGAWTQFKSTSIAAWVREDYMHPRGPIELIASKAVPLSVFNGSKGAVSVLLKLWGQHTCFLGCHMPASSAEDRVRARVWILGRLCEWYGGVANATLDAVFHHVIWMGDFNFRTKQIAAAAAVKLLEDGQLAELLQHDECFSSEGRDLRQAGFKEAPITFPPTYKKADGRPPADVRDPRWPEREYQTKYTVKWYKGRHQEDRIPSWTDRVFTWSLPELRSLLRVQHGMYYAAMPRESSNFLNASDHSPVACCMECFPLDPFYSMPPVFSIAACAPQQGSS
ncbi:inositol polyphosphate 5-phosphatase K-like [Ochotona princeps]|uniref:inositol polyphosphate 5-phosphatase K-like n=1 Tax=Ochotona princeps TaxID=9978 RepID=UPI0027154BBD|nr:inositol polyphosphate 5-phosphatase K-like [Ochotona princeps]